MHKDATSWVDNLELREHPEGGYYRETYRSRVKVSEESLPEQFSGDRDFSTAIYYLLKGTQKSKLHRIKSDEIWHFYAGSGLTIHQITSTGKYTTHHLGPDPEKNQYFQHVVPAETWFGATVDDPESFTLAGCTVAPGFHFSDFEMGTEAELLKLFPQHQEIIQRLTD